MDKKKKLYQVAKELNIASETLIAFLTKKGFEAKTINSTITDEMNVLILSHFKKEKESVEKHQRKIQSFKSAPKKEEKKVEKAEPAKTVKKTRRVKEEEIPVIEIAAAAEIPVSEIISAIVEPPAPEIVEPTPVVENNIAEEVVVTEPEQKIIELIQLPELPPVTQVEMIEQVQPEEKTDEEILEKKTKKSIPRLTPKMGLTIRGKMELTKPETEKPATPAAKDAHDLVAKAKKKKRKRKKKVEEAAPVVETKEDDVLDRKKKKKKKIRHIEINVEEVESAIRRTIAEMDDTSVSARAQMRKKKKKERLEEVAKLQEEIEKQKSKLKVTEFVSVNELANLMQVNVADVIKKCIELGLMVSINQRLDQDTITLIASEFGLEVEFMTEFEERLVVDTENENEELLEWRPPVVTIMGHVDHGKTSLLDFIRETNVVAGEAGGITQHIGAYSVKVDEARSVTFLDTPGHEAFTAMRARGAQLTDIVVLVVAADDAVMPQTVEAISHAQAANVPIVIAMNKIDKPGANPERIRQQLSEKNILVEEWGGKYQSVELSAKTGKNVKLLLEKILLEAEVLNLKAVAKTKARGAVIEAQLDKGRGTVATVLVKKGTLKIGDPFIAGFSYGKVRAMFDERGHRVESAGPSTPVQVIGFDTIPQAGDLLVVSDSERDARDISVRRQQLKREQDFREIRTVTLDTFSQKVKEGTVKELTVVLKGDVDGSVGAISDALMKIANPEVRVNVIHKGVGAISESDVLLAAASNAIIIGFHVRPNVNARILAEAEKVEIRFYTIIYEVINDVKKALEGMLAPEEKEEVLGSIEVRNVFKIPKAGTIAGCYILNGKITRNSKVRLIRDGLVLFDGGISSLKRFKDDVREVDAGYECGIALEGYYDVKIADIIEPYKIVELKRKLI